MKNIHVLPTDKPSRIIKNQDNDFILLNTYAPNWFEINLKTTKQNIYITSDEEIKGGDWCYHPLLKWGSVIKSKYDEPNSTMKKIILTTDQDLIKDGVQAIDDEFLEWFVKNPSCEEVEVNYENYKKGVGLMTSTWRISEDDYYKIIIPKEEPKQCDICKRYPRLEGTNKCESCYSVVRHVLEQDLRFKDNLLPDLRKKQETLEEIKVIKRTELYNSILSIVKQIPRKEFESDAMDAGSCSYEIEQLFLNWQAERMYSEEEVGELLYNVIGEYGNHYGIMIDGKMLNDLFEQFKKK